MLRFLIHHPVDNWQQYALCKGTEPDLWFSRGGAIEQAKEICTQCPVRLSCGAEAVQQEIGEPWVFGVRGGIGPEQRRKLSMKLRKVSQP